MTAIAATIHHTLMTLTHLIWIRCKTNVLLPVCVGMPHARHGEMGTNVELCVAPPSPQSTSTTCCSRLACVNANCSSRDVWPARVGPWRYTILSLLLLLLLLLSCVVVLLPLSLPLVSLPLLPLQRGSPCVKNASSSARELESLMVVFVVAIPCVLVSEWSTTICVHTEYKILVSFPQQTFDLK